MGPTDILKSLLARFGAQDLLAADVWYILVILCVALALLIWRKHWPGLLGAFFVATAGFAVWTVRTIRKKI